MPVRATVTILATIVGVVILFLFRTPTPPAVGSTGLPATSSSASAQAAPSSRPAATAPPNGEQDDNNPSASPAPAAPTASPPTAAAGYRDGTFTGQDVPNQFGDVQVKVVIAGGRITDVQAVQLPSDRERSAFISQNAGPVLRTEALQAQSARIDIVSGATYTSQSYAGSLQSALDQAHA